MAPDRRLTRPERLRGKRSIDSLFESGESGFVYPFRYMWRLTNPGTGDAAVSILASAPKRNHKRANVRNTLKRRTREAYRLNKTPLVEAVAAQKLHLALVYSSKQQEEFKTIEDAVKKILSRITARLG